MHPILLHAGRLYLPTFGVLATLGVLGALALTQDTAPWAGVDADGLWDTCIFMVFAAYLCSRVLLIAEHFKSFLAAPLLLLLSPSLTPAGLLCVLLLTLVWLRRKHVPILAACDALAPCAALLWAFLALGHFAEGSDPGLPSGASFGLALPRETTWLYPVALYVAAAAAMIAAGTWLWLRGRRWRGTTAGWALVSSGLAQFLLCFLRAPRAEGWLGLDDLEWLSLGLIAGGALLLATATPAHSGSQSGMESLREDVSL